MAYYSNFKLPPITVNHIALNEILSLMVDSVKQENSAVPKVKIKVTLKYNNVNYEKLEDFYEFACVNKEWLKPDKIKLEASTTIYENHTLKNKDIELEIGQKGITLSASSYNTSDMYEKIKVIEETIKKYKEFRLPRDYLPPVIIGLSVCAGVIVGNVTGMPFGLPAGLFTFALGSFSVCALHGLPERHSKIEL